MIETIIEVIILVILAFCIGIFISTASGTAATLLIPVLTIFLGYSNHNSIGTSLAFDSFIGLTAGLIYLKNKKIDLKSSAILVLFGVTGSIIGSQFTTQAPETGLKIFFAFFLLFIGFNFARRGIRKNVEYFNKKIKFSFLRKNKTFSFILLGVLVGVMSGFSGLGSGRTIAVILIFVLAYDFHTAVGTSLIMMFFIAGTGALNHAYNGGIMYDTLAVLVIPGLLGSLIGSKYANKIDEDKLARIAGLIIFTFGLIIFLNALF